MDRQGLRSGRAAGGALVVTGLACLVGCGGGDVASSALASPSPGPPSWTLTWSDEFDGADGSAPDASKWTPYVSGNGGGNNELEYYTDRLQNAHVQGGNLVVTAMRESFTGADGTRDFTSARLATAGTFQQVYGRFEARMKLPRGQGMWPAFWMLGQNYVQAGWPQCGEMDIMENVGFEPSTVHATIHGPGYSGAEGIGAPYSLSGAAFADDFHVFAMEWQPNVIRFYVDGSLYATRTPASLPAGTAWVFDDHPFWVILNLAVGGSWPGPPDVTTAFPQSMLVDYVRIYRQAE